MASMKCKRTGRTVYPMENPIKIKDGIGQDAEELVYSKAGFTCAKSGAKLTMNNYVLFNGDVYHKHHVPNTRAPIVSSSSPIDDPILAKARSKSNGAAQTQEASGGDPASVAGSASVEDTPAPTAARASAFGGTMKIGRPPTSATVSENDAVPQFEMPSANPGPRGAKPSPENLEKFREVNNKTPDEQSHYFLMQFAVDFSGRSEEILERAEGFKKYLEPGAASLSEQDSHRLLEELGRAKTYQEMRDIIREIDQDSDGRVSLLEWLLFELGKTVNELMANKCPPELADIVQAAIDQFRKIQGQKAAKKSERQQLEELAAKGGIKGMQAKLKLAQLDQVGDESSEDIRADIKASRDKKKAEKLVEEYAKQKAAEEQARVQAIKEEEERERQRKKAAGRASLLAMASKFSSTGGTDA